MKKIRYSVQPRDQVSVKGYRFLSFAKNMGKNIGKNISKNLSGKDSQKRLDHAKQSATDAIKTSKRVIQKTAEAIGDLVSNKTANKITKVSKNLEIVTNENNKEISKVSPKKRQEIIDDLRLK